MKTLSGTVLTPTGFIMGAIEIGEDGRVARIVGEPLDADRARDTTGNLLLPGFIDTHVHGGGGRDTMEGLGAIETIARVHAQFGTTSMLATTMTAPPDDLVHAFEALREACHSPAPASARVLGVHLEGPYINPAMLGAQPDFARPLLREELMRLNAVAPIRLVTLAPEVASNMQFIGELVAAGFVVQLGHTAGSFDDAMDALSRGAKGFTHLFNAMTGLHHRKPGMVGAALSSAEYAEIIPDLLHVHPAVIRVAMRAIPKLFCVTDSTAAAGMPDGEYRLGRHTVTKCMGGVRLPDGTLAGSTLTMDIALANLVDKVGLSLEEASRRVSTYAADYLGISERGRLAVGALADIVQIDRDLKIKGVMVEGRPLI